MTRSDPDGFDDTRPLIVTKRPGWSFSPLMEWGFGHRIGFPVKFIVLSMVFIPLGLINMDMGTRHHDILLASGFVAWLVASAPAVAMFFIPRTRGRAVRRLASLTMLGWFVVVIALFAIDGRIGAIPK
ncbi:MAG TPA: hypothetical protein VGN37_00605 [Actinocatenispora sp.]